MKSQRNLKGKAVLELVELDEGTYGPLLSTFSQNVPQNLETQEFTLLKKRDLKTALHTSTDQIDYVAKNLKRQENSQYLLGFHSTKNNKIRLVPVQGTFNFQQLIKNNQNGNNEYLEFDQEAKGAQRSEIIIQELGTKKSKKMWNQKKNKTIDEARIRSATEIKQIIKMQAGEFKEEIETKEAEDFQNEWNRKRAFLPDFNLSARTPDKIYSLKSLIPTQDQALLDVSNFEDFYLHHYVRNLMEAFNWQVMDAETAQNKKQQLLYLNYMIKMKKLRKVNKPLEELSESMGVPVEIMKSFIERFYEPIKLKDGLKGAGGGVKYSKTKNLDTKMVCYILILNLIIMRFKINLKPLMKVLKLDEKKALLIAKEIGCTETRKGESLFIKLRRLRLAGQKGKKKRARN